MLNSRPVNNPKMQEALDKIKAIYLEYDLAGGAYLVDPEEMAFTYRLPASWNAFFDEPLAPMNLRIKASTSGPGGKAAANRLINGAATVIASMEDFGAQTSKWGMDFRRILQQQGFTIEHTRFGGTRLPDITSAPWPGSSEKRKGERHE